MANTVDITSSNSIKIQIAGKTVAGVQSYSVKYNRDVRKLKHLVLILQSVSSRKKEIYT